MPFAFDPNQKAFRTVTNVGDVVYGPWSPSVVDSAGAIAQRLNRNLIGGAASGRVPKDSIDTTNIQVLRPKE